MAKVQISVLEILFVNCGGLTLILSERRCSQTYKRQPCYIRHFERVENQYVCVCACVPVCVCTNMCFSMLSETAETG